MYNGWVLTYEGVPLYVEQIHNNIPRQIFQKVSNLIHLLDEVQVFQLGAKHNEVES